MQGAKRAAKTTMASADACDLLSNLPDDIRGHILSFLPSDEAARAAVLSTRWRHIFASVDTISLEQPEGRRYLDGSLDADYFFEVKDRSSLNALFTHRVTAALLCRRLSAGRLDVPLRRLRVSLFRYGVWDSLMVDQWIAYALRMAAAEFHLELRLCTVATCRRDEAETGPDSYYHRDDDGDDVPGAGWSPGGLGWGIYNVPRRIFQFVALRTLCLQMFSMDDKAPIHLPLLDTLSLSKTFDTGAGIRRLISGCPRLTDLTLEECWKLKDISILDKRLRRFTLRCCHTLRVKVDASELNDFEYRGAVPMESSDLSLVGGSHRIIISCNIDFCGHPPWTKNELMAMRMFLARFVGVQRLRLSSARLGCYIESKFFGGFPSFGCLRCLELAGYLLDPTIVDTVAKILEQTPNLELLSFFISPKTIRDERRDHELKYEEHPVPNIPDASPACLRRRVRQINLVHYQGDMAQRMVAKWLLQNALALSKISVVLPKGPLWIQESLVREIKGWSVNQSAKMLFSFNNAARIDR